MGTRDRETLNAGMISAISDAVNKVRLHCTRVLRGWLVFIFFAMMMYSNDVTMVNRNGWKKSVESLPLLKYLVTGCCWLRGNNHKASFLFCSWFALWKLRLARVTLYNRCSMTNRAFPTLTFSKVRCVDMFDFFASTKRCAHQNSEHPHGTFRRLTDTK